MLLSRAEALAAAGRAGDAATACRALLADTNAPAASRRQAEALLAGPTNAAPAAP